MKRNILYIILLLAGISQSLFAGIITVTDGGDSGAKTLRQAIADASPGDTIYFSGVDSVEITSGALSVYNKGLTIDGGVSKVTITRNTTSAFRIFTLYGNENSEVVLNNLVISNGYHTSQAGGIQNGVTLTMNNCEIRGNRSNQAGGMQNDHILVMNNCLFLDNIYDGGLMAGGDYVTASNCVFSENEGFGIKASNNGTIITLTNCIISNNLDNPASGSRPGYGMSFSGAAGSSITNCTVVGNDDDGLRLNDFAENITIVNSIFSDNTEHDIDVGTHNLQASSTNNFVSSASSGGLVDGVNGNIVGGSSEFVNLEDPDGLDNAWLTSDDGLALTSASPGLNNGTNTGAPITDIIGNTRPYNSGIADMGAYEYSQEIPFPTITMHPKDTTTCGNEVAFEVETTDAVNFYWQVKVGAADYTNVTSGGVYSGEISKVLTISDVSGLEGNLYRCIAKNALGDSVISNAGSITIIEAPSVSYEHNTGYQVGSEITPITPLSTGGTVDSYSISPALVAGLNFNTSTGVISGTPSSSSSSTTYTITATNNCGSVNASVTFSTSTSPPPVITSQPINANVCGAAPTSFSLSASNATTYKWQLNAGSAWEDVPSGAPYSGRTSSTLGISGSAGLNGFMYRCIVSNASGTVISDEVTLLEGQGNVMVTSGSNSGNGTLRDAIDCVSSGDTIFFAPNVSLVTLTSGDLIVNKSIVIDGGESRVTIRKVSGSKFRIFTVQSGITVVFNKLNITKGETTDQAGGIQNGGHLTLNYCNVTDNKSPQGNGIQNDHILVLNNCSISDNDGNSNGGGMTMYGDSTIANNTIFSNNGGDGLKTSNGSVVITLNSCLFVNNGQSGVRFGGGAGSSVTNCTFADNDGNGINIGSSASNITIVNSVFAENGSADIAHSSTGLGASSTNNLIGSSNAGGLVNGVNGNVVDVPVLFLDNTDADGADDAWFTADDGFSLSGCSPAINAGVSSGAVLATDILGNARFGNTDIGAYEYQSVSALEAIASDVMADLIDVCPGSTVTLTGSCEGSGVLTWYDLPSGGTALGTGVSFTQNPTENITYYAACNAGSCEGPRTATEEVQMLPNEADIENSLTLSSDFSDDTIQLANDYINATNKIIAPADVIYHSGKAVNLSPGFESQNGSVFLARADITTCPE